MKSFFGWCFVKTNEGRLTLEHLYTPAPAFLQFFGGGELPPTYVGGIIS